MAKYLILLFLVLGLPYAQAQQSRAKVVANYTKEIGVRERTGHNDGVRVETYLASVGQKRGAPWCAAFVHFVFVQSGVRTTITAYSPTTVNPKGLRWYKNRLLQEPQPADVFSLYFQTLGRVGHTGFYARRVNRSFYETVEGNTSVQGSRDGDGVYRRIRSYNTTYAISNWIGD